MQPARHLQLPPLPELLLRLQRLEGQPLLQAVDGGREFQADSRADLGQHFADSVDFRAGGELRTPRAQEIRHLSRLRCYLRHRDYCYCWRRMRLRRRRTLLCHHRVVDGEQE